MIYWMDGSSRFITILRQILIKANFIEATALCSLIINILLIFVSKIHSIHLNVH